MRKFITLFGILALLTISALAKHVDENTAKKVGTTFLLYSTKTLNTSVNLSLAYKSSSSTKNANARIEPVTFFYIFNNGTNGYVIVSGDDRVIPILGYSNENAFDPNKVNKSIQKWIEGYKYQILFVIDNNVSATKEIHEDWNKFINGTPLFATRATSSVNPLVATKWDQAPYENALCPFDNDYNQRTVTGCPATAMAQIMKYWNYPKNGTGFHSYNHPKYGTLSANFGSTSYQWNSMPNILNSSNNAVSTLMYHCGVAVEMNYGVAASGGSGSYVIVDAAPSPQQTCENAFKTYFGYNSSTLKGLKRSNYSDANWINLLQNELNQGRPIQYAGFGSGGHTWVCDGYDNNNLFHMNWGWGGYQDGYFELKALNPGSGGIGGAGYSYNNNQQALIGIQPGNSGTPQTYDLKLYSNINMPSTQIWFTNPISLTVDIANFGNGIFSGQLGAAVFDKNLNFVDFIATNNVSIQNGYYNTITFNNPGSASFVPGTYYVAVYYKTSVQNWTIVGNGNYSNLKQFEIIYSSDIETNSVFTINTNGGKLIQGQSATINVDLLNAGSSTFYGQYRISLSNLNGTFAQSIQILNENNGLPSGYRYTGGNNFSGLITVAPGTYLLEVAYKTQGSSTWYYAGSTKFSNPIYVIVQAPTISADQYENNNTISQSYTLPLTFSGNSILKNTTGSNFHIGTDYDFYKINLPVGFNYTITPRLHDSYNSGNGNTYSVDGLFAYSTNNGNSWSDFYDDIITGNISVQNGGTVYFHVAPYFSGETGTYLLDMTITRTVATGISDDEINESITVYPNPTKDRVVLDLQKLNATVNHVNILNVKGQIISRTDLINQRNQLQLSLSEFTSGIYFIQIHSSKGILTRKVILEK